MPIAQEKIENYLDYVPKPPRPVKDVHRSKLYDRIYEATDGIEYTNVMKGVEPWPHQLEALTFCLEQQRAMLFIKVRRGKTKISLDWMNLLYQAEKIERVLVIVPQPIVLEVWRMETPKHSDLTIDIARTPKELANMALDGKSNIVAVHWGTLLSFAKHGKQKAEIDEHRLEALAECFQAGVVDEMHKCKNHQSLRWKMACTIFEHFEYKLGLTGTPFARNPFDLWAQMYLIDGGKALTRSYWFFEEAFGKRKKSRFSRRKGLVWNERKQANEMTTFEMVFDMAKADLLTNKLRQSVISYGWEGAENIPELIHSVVDIPMSHAQATFYNDELKKAVAQKDEDFKKRTNTLAALREISSGFLKFADANGIEHTINSDANAKMEWLESFLEEVGDSASIVIVHEFIRTGELICETIEKLVTRKQEPIKLKYGHIRGGTQGAGELLRFFMQKKLSILVINWRSVSMGVDLSVADYQLFVETPISSIDRAQVEARAVANRAGRPLFLDDLICSPVERRILRYLKEGKGRLQDLVYADDTFAMVEE